MPNVIIYNNNLSFIKKYTNILSTQFNNIKIIGIISTKAELIDICNKYSVSLIILDERDYNKKSIKPYLINIKRKILVYRGDTIFKNNNTIYLPSNLTKNSIYNALQNFLNNCDENYLKKKIHKLLKYLSFDFKLKGTNYLVEAIIYSYINKNEYLHDNLEKNVYPYLAQKHNISTSIIKHSIIRSINCLNSNCVKTYFTNVDKITSKTVITEIVNKI